MNRLREERSQPSPSFALDARCEKLALVFDADRAELDVDQAHWALDCCVRSQVENSKHFACLDSAEVANAADATVEPIATVPAVAAPVVIVDANAT